MVEIPPEIVELFLYQLNASEKRKTNLKNCCIVSHTWRSIAQPLLFSSLTLHTETSNTETLAETVIQSPQLIPYVDYFCISGRIDSAYDTIINVARIAANLNPCTLQLWWTFSRVRRRVELHSSIISILPSLLSSTRLTTLHLLNVTNFPATFFRHCTVLTALSLSCCTFSETDQPDSTLSIRLTRPKLHNLTLLADKPSPEELHFLDWCIQPYCPLDLSELKVFTNASMPTQAFEIVCRFVKVIGRSLEAMSVDPNHLHLGPTYIFPPFPAEGLCNLRSLTITMVLAYMTPTTVHFSWVIDLLSNLPKPNLLNQLILDCVFNLPGRPRPDIRPHDWDELDRVLSLAAFANLENLVIMCDGEDDDVLFENLKTDLLGFLPRSSADPRKKLVIRHRTILDLEIDVGF
ncbi:hypothetical protein BDN72DRAFT_566774 [Pluteus cervinus]|uniref:Uncharacterized protein n=1 Tax=Pluteus cervinus TaxID=181527 RepID=A0ACD3AWM5_9AGAR|nr:hypothetical protein BDN72DRAFT_566774 [Pluteus cervinus]